MGTCRIRQGKRRMTAHILSYRCIHRYSVRRLKRLEARDFSHVRFTKTFGDHEVLKGVDVHVEKGDVIAILGPSGSGKTTLLRCMNFLEQADSGTMIFDNEEIDLSKVTSKQIRRIRQKTGFVFQNYCLFNNKTALQNVTEGLIIGRKMKKEEAVRIGKKALDKVGLSDKYDFYPHQLSGGQQQRVGIARAIATDPEVIFLMNPHQRWIRN